MAANEILEPGYKLSVVCSYPATITSGLPVLYGSLTGVALTDKGAGGNAATYTTVDFGPGGWSVSVFDGAATGVAVGDPIYFATTPVGTPAGNLTNVATSNFFFGIANGVVSANATTTINVIHIPYGASSVGAGGITATQLGTSAVTAVKIAANVITDAKVALTTSGNVLGTLPVIYRQDFVAGANADATIVVTDKVLAIDAWLVLTGAGVATEVVTLKNGASAMAAAMAASGADGTIVHAATFVTAQRTIAQGGSLVISPGTGASQPAMSVFVLAMPTA